MAGLKDIAKLCGCDISTVSRALQGSPRVKETTKKKILSAAKKLNYTPNFMAQSLARGKTNVIGYLVPSLVSETENLPALHISRFLVGSPYDLIISQYHEDIEIFKRNLKRMECGGADFIVIGGAEFSLNSLKSILEDCKLPYIFLDRYIPDLNALTITSNNFDAAKMITESLIESSVDGIIHFFSRPNSASIARKEGVMTLADRVPIIEGSQEIKRFLEKNNIKKLGLVASLEQSLKMFVESNKKLFEGIDLYASVFDHWNGSKTGFKNIFLVEQNWEALAKQVVDTILHDTDLKELQPRIMNIPCLPVEKIK